MRSSTALFGQVLCLNISPALFTYSGYGELLILILSLFTVSSILLASCVTTNVRYFFPQKVQGCSAVGNHQTSPQCLTNRKTARWRCLIDFLFVVGLTTYNVLCQSVMWSCYSIRDVLPAVVIVSDREITWFAARCTLSPYSISFFGGCWGRAPLTKHRVLHSLYWYYAMVEAGHRSLNTVCFTHCTGIMLWLRQGTAH